MYQLINMVNDVQMLKEFTDAADLKTFYQTYGCNGLEVILGDQRDDVRIAPNMVIGCHMLFYSDWLDFWRNDQPRLLQKFGSKTISEEFYRAKAQADFVAQFQRDLEYAAQMNARYVVFHVSDVSIEESFTYRWQHQDEAVIDATADLLNQLTDGREYQFELLLENLWWPGFSMTNPALTQRLLERVHYPRKGLLLDTGHLLNTNLDLSSQEEGCAYLMKMLDEHGSLCRFIRGVHLHQSLSGTYVKQSLEQQPVLQEEFYARFAQGYEHILQIDRHQPFTCSAIRNVIERIAPEYLVYELAAANRQQRAAQLSQQIKIWDSKKTPQKHL